MAAGRPLSAAVEDARERGFTEPDPLEDLSGRDVARKLVIMLREAGLEDIAVEREPVVADDWADAARQGGDVIASLRSKDGEWRQPIRGGPGRRRNMGLSRAVWARGATVGPVRLPRHSAFARLGGSGNLARIDLADAPDTPVEVHGPGAGVSVTASAVLSDLVDAAGMLCAKR